MAFVVVRCPHCQAPLNVPAEAAGKRVKCPKCQQALLAPAAPSNTVHGSHPLEESTADGPGDATKKLAEFLRPPQRPDELGRLGHFRILKELGHGGMGMVFLAEDLLLVRPVALKVMLPEFAAKPEAKKRFEREARTAANIDNDHIITIHEVNEDNGVPFLTMPVLKGESLYDRLKRDARLPLADVVSIGWQICDGLQAAHDRKLVHRDLKPANIWLESREKAAAKPTTGIHPVRVKILDFGLARAVETDQHLTRTGVVLGTPSYMAPEQARNPNVDARADLFSLGVLFYRLLTGRLPFAGHDTMSTMFAICHDDPVPPRQFSQKARQLVEEAVHDC